MTNFIKYCFYFLASNSNIALSQSYRLEEAPPPPPPPPYAASFPAAVSKESDVPVTQSSLSLSDYPPRLNNNLTATSVSVPTTDPPSYASSVAALAAKRVVSSVPVSTVVSSTTTNSSSASNLPNISHLPARPPPPLPPNSDLVNTVESICASQVGAIHCNSNGPPLPPKPSTMIQFNDAASITESECSSTSTSISTGNGPVVNNPLSYSNQSNNRHHHVVIQPISAGFLTNITRRTPNHPPPPPPSLPPPPPLPPSSPSPPPPPPPPSSGHSDKLAASYVHLDSNHRYVKSVAKKSLE